MSAPPFASPRPACGSAPGSVRVIGALWRRELARYARDRSMLFGALSRTLLWLVILGFGLGATLREIEGYTYAQYILPGVAILNVLFASLQSAFSLVYDREHGLFRQMLISPAPRHALMLGKVLGGATVATIQGAIPLALMPLIGVEPSLPGIACALLVMFATGIGLTGLGIVIATRVKSFEGFGSVSNGLIQPLYFLSGAIFPLKGIIGGVGFLDIPPALQEELRRHGVHAIGGGWVVELPGWLELLVRLDPIAYPLDLMRLALLGFHQLPLGASVAVCIGFPLLVLVPALRCMERPARC